MRCELEILNGFDKPMVQSAMLEALDVIEEKFPFDSTELKIEAKPTDSYGLTIIKEKGKGPFLKRIWCQLWSPICDNLKILRVLM